MPAAEAIPASRQRELSKRPDLGEIVGVAGCRDEWRAVAVGEVRSGQAQVADRISQHDVINAGTGIHNPVDLTRPAVASVVVEYGDYLVPVRIRGHDRVGSPRCGCAETGCKGACGQRQSYSTKKHRSPLI